MTQQLLEPGAGFLNSGNPENFLSDNLPVAESTDPRQRHHAVALAGAFLAWRMFFSSELRKSPPPQHTRTLVDMLYKRLVPSWLRISAPVVLDIVREQGPMAWQEQEAVALDYAVGLGDYIHQTSADALVQGYEQELKKGISPSLAWLRVSEGYGLDARRLRGWMAGTSLDQTALHGDLVSPSARRALDRALMTRATVLGETEAWQAKELAKTVVWMNAEKAGSLPAGTGKKWLTADDERVCPICGPLHKQVVKLDEHFVLPNGAQVWAPGVHPNCRCEVRLNISLDSGSFQIEKNAPGDPYNRDQQGQFARRETRRAAPVTHPERDPRVDAMLARVGEVSEEEKDVKDPFISTDPFKVQVISGWSAPTADPFTISDPFTRTDAFTAADAFMGTGKSGKKAPRRTLFIMVDGEPTEVEAEAPPIPPDMAIFAPVFYYQNEVFGMGYDRSGLGSEIEHMTNETIDLDEYAKLRGEKEHRPAAAFRANVIRPGDSSRKIYDAFDPEFEYSDLDLSEDMYGPVEQFTEERSRQARNLTDNPEFFVNRLAEPDIREIYQNAGQLSTFNVIESTKMLRDNLIDAIQGGDNSPPRLALLDSYLEWHFEHDPNEQLSEAIETIENEEGTYAEHFFPAIPQVFTFNDPENRYANIWMSEGNEPSITGKWRVERTIIHSATREFGSNLPNPRIPAYREVVLRPVHPITGDPDPDIDWPH